MVLPQQPHTRKLHITHQMKDLQCSLRFIQFYTLMLSINRVYAQMSRTLLKVLT